MKARQLHLPHTCLANCCSGHRASRGGVWELTEARIGIPALCWVEQGMAVLSKAVQVVFELKLEHLPIWGCTDTGMWHHVPCLALPTPDPVQLEEPILFSQRWGFVGDFFSVRILTLLVTPDLCYTREFCLFQRISPHTGLKQVQKEHLPLCKNTSPLAAL